MFCYIIDSNGLSALIYCCVTRVSNWNVFQCTQHISAKIPTFCLQRSKWHSSGEYLRIEVTCTWESLRSKGFYAMIIPTGLCTDVFQLNNPALTTGDFTVVDQASTWKALEPGTKAICCKAVRLLSVFTLHSQAYKSWKEKDQIFPMVVQK